jgi:hypothetical protein
LGFTSFRHGVKISHAQGDTAALHRLDFHGGGRGFGRSFTARARISAVALFTQVRAKEDH